MKYSLRFKLFIAFVSLIIFFIGFSWLLNNFLLEKYYFYEKKDMLLKNYKTIDTLYNGDPETVLFKLEELDRNQGMHTLIADKNFNVKCESTPNIGGVRPPNFLDSQFPQMFLFKAREKQLLKGETIIENMKDDRLNANFVNLISFLNNGDIIFMNIPVAAIKESVDIANRFFLFTGILTIIIGTIFVFLVTGRFTKPILQLNEIAQRISMLDFEKKYPVKTHDEIGQLGESINSLSNQLEKSILELLGANDKLKEEIEKERKIDEMRKEFISSVSHELKTPIALIQGYAEGLKININEDEENKNFYCDVITDESLKMDKLVKQLLDLAQIESGNLILERVNFDISGLIEYVVKKYTMLFNEKGIEVTFENKYMMVNADFDKIDQVLVNYISNAFNHVDDRKIIKIEIKQIKEKCRIMVYNSGYHIPFESMDKIWTSFYKEDKARSRGYGGSGLGLSIVRAIMDAHENNFGVNNVKNGVEFWFELDLVKGS